ncbi:hypothetical protein CHUAL_013630 [Chamberlinius hualienensis]
MTKFKLPGEDVTSVSTGKSDVSSEADLIIVCIVPPLLLNKRNELSERMRVLGGERKMRKMKMAAEWMRHNNRRRHFEWLIISILFFGAVSLPLLVSNSLSSTDLSFWMPFFLGICNAFYLII